MILALDIATRTGVAVGIPGERPRAWSEDLGKGQCEDARLSRMLKLTHSLIEEHKPKIVAVEMPAVGKTPNHFLIGLAACARGMAFNQGAAVEIYAANTVRKHFLGKALQARDFPGLNRANAKLEIKRMVANRCKALGWGDLDYDAADAAALWDLACACDGAQVMPVGELFHG